jgi:hypothetical protein
LFRSNSNAAIRVLGLSYQGGEKRSRKTAENENLALGFIGVDKSSEGKEPCGARNVHRKSYFTISV